MKVIVDLVIIYNIKKELKVRIEMSNNNNNSGGTDRFYIADFVKHDITLKEGILFFSKYLLKEYYIITKSNVKKQILFVINYYNDKVIKSFKNNNLWLDQLEALLELCESRIVYNKIKESK